MRKYKSDYTNIELLNPEISKIVKEMLNVPPQKLYVYFSDKPFDLKEALCAKPIEKRLAEDFQEVISRNLTNNESVKDFAARIFNKLQEQCNSDHKNPASPVPSSHDHTCIIMRGYGEMAELRGAVNMYRCMSQDHIEVVASEKVAARVATNEK